MNNSTLKEFFYGNLTPENRQIMRGSHVDKIVKRLSEDEEKLKQVLTPEHKPVLDSLLKGQATLDSITAEEYYIDGFKTGARFMMEILDDTHENLKPLSDDGGIE